MILKGLFFLVTALINLIPFSLPALPESLTTVVSSFKTYLIGGIGMLKAYTDWSYLMVLFNIVLTMEAVFYGYKLVMWIISKIPALNVK